MATDRKADYVGNHGGAYTDIDGMRKQFTTIDHDKKTSISREMPEKIDYQLFFKEYRSELIKRITDLSASFCHPVFQDFTIRGEKVSEIQWNTDMLLDAGLPLQQLRDICVTTENRAENTRLMY